MIPMSALLGLLRPSTVPANSAQGPDPAQLQGADFDSLLTKARGGQLASGREVTVAKGAGVRLSPDQLARISIAADKAEAQGATRALVTIDGHSFKLDITARQITGAVDLTQGGVLTGIDAVLRIPSDKAAATDPRTLPLPRTGAGMGNASLLRALSGPRPGEARADQSEI